MANTVITQFQKLKFAKALQYDILYNFNPVYFFVGNHRADVSPDELYNAPATQHSAYRNIIQGVKVEQADVSVMTRNIPWVSGTVFDDFDDQDTSLLTKDFFCVVNGDIAYHVFKCLDNNHGANSTVQPDIAHISGANTNVYETSDGYRWKYMYSVSSTIANNFSSQKYFPIVANTTVEDAAVPGAIDIVKVESNGVGYSNYLTGTFFSADLRVNGNSTLYLLSGQNAASNSGHYTGCVILITAGAGVGQYREITDYIVNGNGNFVVLDTQFQANAAPENGTQYVIRPKVEVKGDGEETVNAVGMAIINSVQNSIHKVEMLERGQNYFYATATVKANSVVLVSQNASVRAILPPSGGHGANSEVEMPFAAMAVRSVLNGHPDSKLLHEGQYQSYGLLHRPLFGNVVLGVNSVVGTSFLAGETAMAIEPFAIALAEANGAVLAYTNANVHATFLSETPFYLVKEDLTAQCIRYLFSQNSTSLTMSANVPWSGNTAVFLANPQSEFAIDEIVDSVTVIVDKVPGGIETGGAIIGISSGTKATVNSITRNGIEKGFENFIGLHKWSINIPSTAFVENEWVHLSSNTELGGWLYFGNSSFLFTSNQVHRFGVGDTIVGNTSGAVATVTGAYHPEINPGSGELLFMRNMSDPVERANSQNEVFRIFLTF